LDYFLSMAYALAKEQLEFIDHMVKVGRFNNQSEVVREAVRRMQREETAYLNPPPLTPEEVEQIYGPNPEAEKREAAFARAAMASIRKRKSRA